LTDRFINDEARPSIRAFSFRGATLASLRANSLSSLEQAGRLNEQGENSQNTRLGEKMKAKSLLVLVVAALAGWLALCPAATAAWEDYEWYQGQRGHWYQDRHDRWHWIGVEGDEWHEGHRGHWYQEDKERWVWRGEPSRRERHEWEWWEHHHHHDHDVDE